ncbi:MAG TPA: pilus assembly protein N-terminal domain-containing protein [bacterium]|nr:pilus assembly protein N-terminal domain-containing protein [bacterium]
MSALGTGLFCVVLVALASGGGSPASGAGPATLTVYIAGGTTRTALRLQPGFATVLRADRRVDTVAIGDPRLVTATTVKRGGDVYDLVLQPQAATGTTNMIVWFADLTSIWDLTIGPGPRTTDLVYVVTTPPPNTRTSPPLVQATLPQPSTPPAGPQASTPDLRANPRPERPEYLEARQTFGEAAGVFQLFRGPGGIKIRYRITNTSATDLSVRPNGVLIRANGVLVPFGMSRENADRSRPAVLPPGATESGMINASVPAPRQVEVIFSLFRAKEDRQSPGGTLPAVFQLLFAGLDRLPASSAP